MIEVPCVCISLRKAGRKLTARYDAALAPAGIGVTQFSLLRNIERHGPASLTRLGELVELDRSTLGRNLRVLARLELVELTPGADQREAVVRLTGQGKRTLAEAEPLWRGAQDGVRQRLGVDGAEALDALLSVL